MSDGLEVVTMITEIASTVGKGFDFATDCGLPSLVKESVGLIENKIACMKFEDQIKYFIKIKRKLDEIGYPYILKPIELKLAAPFLEAVSLETDDYMQELWANLLINSSIEKTGVDLNRTFIDILERLNPFEADILLKIYSLDYEESKNGVDTTSLPNNALVYKEPKKHEKQNEESQEKRGQMKLMERITLTSSAESGANSNVDEKVVLALGNLDRLGCISSGLTMGPIRDFSLVAPTVLGKKFVESCSPKFLSID